MSPRMLRCTKEVIGRVRLSKRAAVSRAFSCRHGQQQQQAPQPPPAEGSPGSVSFGFEDIPESQKVSRVGDVFSSVAPSYDVMNDLMSAGVHRLWKDYFVRSLNPGDATRPQTILDVAGGTGDIAIRMLDHASRINNDQRSRVIISDINADMLREGKQRIQQHYPHYISSSSTSQTPSDTPSMTTSTSPSRVSFLLADAHTFPGSAGSPADSSIDLYTVAFGIRNFTSIPQTLATAYRLLKPGGVFACLEFTPRLSNPLLNGLYKRWSFGAIPLIGQIVAGDRDSYQYLVESIERFPDQQTFARMIADAGFALPGAGAGVGSDVDGDGAEKSWIDLTGGIAAIHKGIKPA